MECIQKDSMNIFMYITNEIRYIFQNNDIKIV
jgi:hypothetical protein